MEKYIELSEEVTTQAFKLAGVKVTDGKFDKVQVGKASSQKKAKDEFLKLVSDFGKELGLTVIDGALWGTDQGVGCYDKDRNSLAVTYVRNGNGVHNIRYRYNHSDHAPVELVVPMPYEVTGLWHHIILVDKNTWSLFVDAVKSARIGK